jgi:macrolide transport system ATP-binding/permease protein
MLSVVGGIAGIGLALLTGGALMLADIAVVFSALAIGGALACALATGVAFGYMPARKAAGLDPVAALTSE